MVFISKVLLALCVSPDSSELFGLTAHHVIKGEPHTEIFFLEYVSNILFNLLELPSFKLFFGDAVDIKASQRIICEKGDAVLFSLQAGIISKSPFFDGLDFTALSREYEELAADDGTPEDDSDRESLRSRVSDYERNEDRTDPTNLEWAHLEAIISDRPIFKFGALSGLTVGTYASIDRQGGIRKIEVEPASDFETFTEHGDSGSVYYIEYSGSLVPIALHFERFNKISRGYYLPDLFHQFRHQEQEIRFLDRVAFLEFLQKLQ